MDQNFITELKNMFNDRFNKIDARGQYSFASFVKENLHFFGGTAFFSGGIKAKIF